MKAYKSSRPTTSEDNRLSKWPGQRGWAKVDPTVESVTTAFATPGKKEIF